MADYYRILARAVSELATNNAHARQELYEHARTVLVAHLDRSNLKRSTQEKISERMAFETAVQRVEAKFLLKSRGWEVWPGPSRLRSPSGSP